MPSRHATPSARPSALRHELGAPIWAWAVVGAALLLAGCATHDDPLIALERAAAMKLAAERPVIRPYARINDGLPWTQVRRVEIDK